LSFLYHILLFIAGSCRIQSFLEFFLPQAGHGIP
jgi:hypothetical protein